MRNWEFGESKPGAAAIRSHFRRKGDPSVRGAVRLPRPICTRRGSLAASRLGGASTRRGAGTDRSCAAELATEGAARRVAGYAQLRRSIWAAPLPQLGPVGWLSEGPQSAPAGAVSEGSQFAPVGSSEGRHQKGLPAGIRTAGKPAMRTPPHQKAGKQPIRRQGKPYIRSIGSLYIRRQGNPNIRSIGSLYIRRQGNPNIRSQAKGTLTKGCLSEGTLSKAPLC